MRVISSIIIIVASVHCLNVMACKYFITIVTKLISGAGTLEFSTEDSVLSRVLIVLNIGEIRMVRSNFGPYIKEYLSDVANEGGRRASGNVNSRHLWVPNFH